MAVLEATDSGNIKILSVVWFKVIPAKFGGQKAVTFFNRHLTEHASLLCLCSKNNERVEASYQLQNDLPVGRRQVFNPFAWRKIYAVVKREGITHLLLEFPYYGIAGILCKKLLGVKLVINTHNVEYMRFKEQKKWWWGLLFLLERMTLRAADLVFFKTAEDLKTAQAKFDLASKRLAVVPYGMEEKGGLAKEEARNIIQQRHAIKHNEKILLFAGSLDYSPNADAVAAITKKLIPLLNKHSLRYKIIVCGRNHSAAFQYLNNLKNNQLITAGEVDDIDVYFNAADVFINPVLRGGGVQTKTMDALSCNLNVVCFASKAVGINHAANKIFTAADNDWNGFARAIVKALESNEPTPASFFEAYNWRSIAAKAYQKILSC